MAIIVKTADLARLHDKSHIYWAYNGLDCAVTREVYDVISRELRPATDLTYRFEMAMQAPAFQMMIRGVAVDELARGRALKELSQLERDIEKEMVEVVGPDWEFKKKRPPQCPKAPKGKVNHKWNEEIPLEEQTCAFCGAARLVSDPFNPRSPGQVMHLLYTKWELPEQFNRKTHKVSVDDECLERLKAKFPARAEVLGRLIEARKVRKQIGFMKAPAGKDGRMHSSFNVGATECLTGDHEVLTRMGWVRIDKWEETQEIVVGDGKFCWFEKCGKVSYPEAETIEIKTSRLSQRVTPNHRLLWKTDKENWHISLAGERRSLHSFPIGGRMKGNFLPGSQARVIVMTQADGHILPQGHVRFHFKKPRKIERCKDLLRDAGLLYKTQTGGAGTTFIIVPNAPSWMKDLKKFGPSILNYDPEDILNELKYWDGSIDRNMRGFTYVTTVEENANWVKTVAHLCGRFAKIAKGSNVGRTGWSDYWRVYVGQDKFTRLPSGAYTPAEPAPVFCARTISGFFLVRHRGQISLTGNTFRWSSSRDPYMQGVNIQQIADPWRNVFVADPGMELFYADLEQAESRVVAYDAGDEAFIKVHEASDTHTEIAKMLWPEVVTDRTTAELPVSWDQDPEHNYRFFAKKIVHGPLTKDHEVLTRRGWISISECPQEVCTYLPSGEAKWEHVRYIESDFEGELVCGRSRHYSADMSPIHRIPVFNNGKLGEQQAQNMPGYARFPKSGILREEESSVGAAYARLLAAVWADGHLTKYNTLFNLKKPRKIERLKSLLMAAELKWKNWKPGREDYELIAIGAVLRKSIGWDILDWSLEERVAFLEELPYWDGHPPTGRVFNTHREELEIIQTIAHISGYSGQVLKHGKPRDNEVQCYYIDLSRQTLGAYEQVKWSRREFRGKVYCAITKAGWFFTKHRGIITITGNSNLGMTPTGIAREAHISVASAGEMQERYFGAFRRVHARQKEIALELRETGRLTNPLGVEKQFFGRLWDDHTIKEGYAFIPQSMVGFILSIGLWRVWRNLDPGALHTLAQVHDAILGQYPADNPRVLGAVLEAMTVPVEIRGREMIIPVAILRGPTWKKSDMKKWKGANDIAGPKHG